MRTVLPFMGVAERTKITKSIKQVWESLQSHLPHAVEAKSNCASCGNRKFHAECVREYAQIIKDLADAL